MPQKTKLLKREATMQPMPSHTPAPARPGRRALPMREFFGHAKLDTKTLDSYHDDSPHRPETPESRQRIREYVADHSPLHQHPGDIELKDPAKKKSLASSRSMKGRR